MSSLEQARWFSEQVQPHEPALRAYPDGAQGKDGLSWITYDRDRNGTGEIMLAKFREQDVAAGKDVSRSVSLKRVIRKLDKVDGGAAGLGQSADRPNRVWLWGLG